MIVNKFRGRFDDLGILSAQSPGATLARFEIEPIDKPLVAQILEHSKDKRPFGRRNRGPRAIDPERAGRQHILGKPAASVRSKVRIAFIGLVLAHEIA